MAGETATFPVKVEADASTALSAAEAMARLDAQISKSEGAIASMNRSLKRMRGTSDEVKKAKVSLRDKIDDEKVSLNAAQKASAKWREQVEKQRIASEKAKKASEELNKAFSGAISKGGGPIADISEKFGGLSEIATGAAGPMGLAVAATAALVAVVYKLGSALVSATADFLEWIVVSSDAARSAGLLREALTGSDQQGAAMTSQINALASKIPTAKDKIDELAKGLYKAGLGGQTFVDTLNAVGRSGAAAGDDVGSKIRGIVERGVMPNGQEGRFSVTLQELRELKSSGLDLAGSFAKSTKTSVLAATQALVSGRVPLARGAAALRQAAEQSFGKINAKQMLALPTIFAKVKESLAGMTRDINLEPLLQGLAKIGSFFSEDTVPGRALKQLITDIGNGLSGLGGKVAPSVFEWLEKLELSALILELELLRLRLAWKQFSDAVGSNNIEIGLGALKDLAVNAILGAVGLDRIRSTITLISGGADLASAAFERLAKMITAKHAEIAALDWSDIGTNIVLGLARGIEGAFPSVVDVLKKLADKVKETFGFHLQISSPSKVFERYGENTAEGFERGVEHGSDDAAEATKMLAAPPAGAARGGRDDAAEATKMLAAPPAGAARGGSPGTMRITNELHLHVATEAAAREMRQDAGFLEKLTHAIEGLNAGAGLPVGNGA